MEPGANSQGVRRDYIMYSFFQDVDIIQAEYNEARKLASCKMNCPSQDKRTHKLPQCIIF
jgi:hypothetical protein